MREVPIKKLKSFFSKRPEINTTVLFGSYSKGRGRKGSDVDIAILLNHYHLVPWEYKSKLIDELDLNIIADVVKTRLDIFSQFSSEIRHWLKKRKKG